MYDLYKALQNGQSADEIAKAFTAELNDAIKQKDAEDKAAQEKEKKMAEQAKYQQAAYIAGALTNFKDTYYPELGEETITNEQVIDVFNSISTLQKQLDGLKTSLFDLFDEKEVPVKKFDKIEDVFTKFFKANNI